MFDKAIFDWPECAGFKRILDRGSAEILKEADGGMLLFDRVSQAYMIIQPDIQKGLEWLAEYPQIRLLSTCDEKLANAAAAEFSLNIGLKCYQAVYCGNEFTPAETDMKIRVADESDMEFLTSNYKMISESELRLVVSRGNLLIGSADGVDVGFVGEHLEGSIGMLYVLPEHRRKGYGAALESYAIKRTLDAGFLPFGQVETDNTASIKLQKSLGMRISDGFVFWLWKEE